MLNRTIRTAAHYTSENERRVLMHSASRISAIALGAALVLTLYASIARADKPTTIPAWFNDRIV